MGLSTFTGVDGAAMTNASQLEQDLYSQCLRLSFWYLVVHSLLFWALVHIFVVPRILRPIPPLVAICIEMAFVQMSKNMYSGVTTYPGPFVFYFVNFLCSWLVVFAKACIPIGGVPA
jgi:hypothetical protein